MTSCLISIIAFNKLAVTKRCVERVLEAMAATPMPCALALTDNASMDGVAEYFDAVRRRHGHPKVSVCHQKENSGFQIPTENSFALAKAEEFDRLVVVNNDCIPPVNFLDVLEAEFQRHPAAAIVGSSDGCCTVNNDLHGYQGDRTDYIELGCASISVQAVAKHYPRLFADYVAFAYGEDLLLSLKMRKRGYSIHRAHFSVEHDRGTTSRSVPKALAAQTANHLAIKAAWPHWCKYHTFMHRLVIRRTHSAGDCLLLTPVIRKLWEENPQSELVVETNFADIFTGNPCVSHAAKVIERRPTDQVFDFTMVSENAPLRHFVTSYARAVGVELEPPFKTEIYWRDDPFAALDWSGKWVALHTGPSTWISKEWKASHWNEVADQLAREGWNILLVGHGKLCGLYGDAILRDFRDRTKTFNELAALLSHCSLFIGLDSACFHVANAVGVPAVGLFGVTSHRFISTGTRSIGVEADPALWPRAGERHRFAGLTEVSEDGSTINSIQPDQVIAAAHKLLQSCQRPSKTNSINSSAMSSPAATMAAAR